MQLLLVPLDDSILFPGMTATIAADVGDADQVFLLPRPDGEYGRIGTIAEVVDTGRLPGGITAVTLTGLRRGRAGTASPAPSGELAIDVEPLDDGVTGGDQIRDLERNYRAVVEEILELRGDDGRVAAFLRSISEPGPLADTSGYSPDISLADKQRLLETVDVTERLELALELQRERLAELQVRRRIRDDVESGAQAQQREYFLRKQMESIRKELGDDDASVFEEYERKIADSAMPDAVRDQATAGARPAREDGRAERRVVDDPHLPRHPARRAVGRALRREARPGRTPARCSTPTTPASRTSRTGSPSTSPSAACAAIAACPTRAGAPARSSP